MPANSRESSVLTVTAIILATLGPLIALPTAMLSLSSKENDSSAKSTSSNRATAESANLPQQLGLGWLFRTKLEEPSDRPLYQFAGLEFKQSVDAVVKELEPQANIDGLIALVPDPRQSSSAYVFDLRLGVLRKAAATHGYVLNRFYLPWQEEADPNAKSEQPGLLLFHRRSTSDGAKNSSDATKNSDLLLVYLVGETATSGLDRKTFHKAVSRLNTWKTAHKSAVKVLGPNFSGTAHSLALAIATFEPEPKHMFHVVAGSANNLDRQRFETLAKDRASLVTTRTSSESNRAALLEFVTKHDLHDVPSERLG